MLKLGNMADSTAVLRRSMMRYFTKELWWKINDEDENVRIQAEKEWDANCLLYQQQFEDVKKRLPRSFLKDYLSRDSLHDYVILGIAVTKRGRNYSCELQLTNGTETVLLTLNGVKKLKIDVDTFQYCIQGALAWGYGEFESTPENGMQLAVLCDMENEMLFQFRSLKLIKQ